MSDAQRATGTGSETTTTINFDRTQAVLSVKAVWAAIVFIVSVTAGMSWYLGTSATAVSYQVASVASDVSSIKVDIRALAYKVDGQPSDREFDLLEARVRVLEGRVMTLEQKVRD